MKPYPFLTLNHFTVPVTRSAGCEKRCVHDVRYSEEQRRIREAGHRLEDEKQTKKKKKEEK